MGSGTADCWSIYVPEYLKLAFTTTFEMTRRGQLLAGRQQINIASEAVAVKCPSNRWCDCNSHADSCLYNLILQLYNIFFTVHARECICKSYWVLQEEYLSSCSLSLSRMHRIWSRAVTSQYSNKNRLSFQLWCDYTVKSISFLQKQHIRCLGRKAWQLQVKRYSTPCKQDWSSCLIYQWCRHDTSCHVFHAVSYMQYHWCAGVQMACRTKICILNMQRFCTVYTQFDVVLKLVHNVWFSDRYWSSWIVRSQSCGDNSLPLLTNLTFQASRRAAEGLIGFAREGNTGVLVEVSKIFWLFVRFTIIIPCSQSTLWNYKPQALVQASPD